MIKVLADYSAKKNIESTTLSTNI